jgi:DNA-binding NarL/FixJ family response regulator
MASAPITVVLADDHPIILAGLENLFQRERDFRILARCTDGVEALRAVEKHQPAVLVLDLNMPRVNGVMVLREMAKASPTTRTVVLAAELEEDQLLEALRLGVRGVVLKEMAPQLLLQCVREVAAGRQWLEKKSVGQALDKLLRHEAAARELTQKLTPREVEIAKAIGSGLRNKEIAEKLSISEGTVKIHLHTIYSKLGVDGRMALLLHLKERAFV